MAKKQNKAGRKKGSGLKSSINPRREYYRDIADRLGTGFREWITPLNKSIKNYEKHFGRLPFSRHGGVVVRIWDLTKQGQRLHDIRRLWRNHQKEHAQAVLHGDAEWFQRQADALKRGYRHYSKQNQGRFDQAVFETLFSRAHSYSGQDGMLGSLRKDFLGCTADDVLDSLRQRKRRDYATEEYLQERDRPKKRLYVEECPFKDRKDALEAIRRLAKQFGFELRNRRGKRPNQLSAEEKRLCEKKRLWTRFKLLPTKNKARRLSSTQEERVNAERD
jgi:hypothetical protein